MPHRTEPGDPSEPLALAFAMSPDTFEAVFPPERRRAFEDVARVLADRPLDSLTTPDAEQVLGRADVLVTGWGAPRIDGDVLDRAPRLRAVVHAAGTVKGHVSLECWDRGIAVSSAATANALPVAEYTVAMILLAGKRVLPIAAALHERRAPLDPQALFPRMGNYDKRIGIVGASTIGRRVVELLRPYDLQVAVADPFLSSDAADRLGVQLTDLPTLMASSDVVSVHAPSLPETRHLIDAAALAALRPGSTIINTARGELIDQDALARRLADGDIFAILDVTTPWTLPADHPLYDDPHVLLTPHIAGSLGTELGRLARTAAQEVARLARGEPLAHPVSRQSLETMA